MLLWVKVLVMVSGCLCILGFRKLIISRIVRVIIVELVVEKFVIR